MTDGIAGVISELERQRAAIDKALAALRGVASEAPTSVPAGTEPAKRKGGMTPEGKKRLIKALKKRWAAKKAAAASTDASAAVAETPAPRKRTFTPEGRRRLAEAMKRRWAVKRAASAVNKVGRKKKAA